MMWIWVLFKEFFFLLKTILVSPRSFFPIEWTKAKRKTPILLVHGYLNRASIWLYLGNKLSKKYQGSVYTLNLKNPFSSIEDFAKQVQKKAKQIEKEQGTNDLILIGHSMGGIVSLYYSINLAIDKNIVRVITLGSPLRGTKMAFLGLGKCAKQMRRGSPFLKKLEESYNKKAEPELFHIATKKDQIVLPYTSSFIMKDKKKRLLLDNIGHMELVYSKEAVKKILYWTTCD